MFYVISHDLSGLTVLCLIIIDFPFCTIDPNLARIPVPDARFKKLCTMYKPKSEVCAMLTITDIAGLVRGASDGAVSVVLMFS